MLYISWLNLESREDFGIRAATDLSEFLQSRQGQMLSISANDSLINVYNTLIQAARRFRPDIETSIRATSSSTLLQLSSIRPVDQPPLPIIMASSLSARGRKRERSTSSSNTIVLDDSDNNEGEKGGVVVQSSEVVKVSKIVKVSETDGGCPSTTIHTSISSTVVSDTFGLEEEVALFFDGGARNNPGLASGAAYIRVSRVKNLAYCYTNIPHSTNNEAEYIGLILGLQMAVHLGLKRVSAFGDSLLVVNQFNGSWQCQKPHLQALLKVAKEIAQKIPHFSIAHIARAQNVEADRLSNMGMDGGRGTVCATYDDVSHHLTHRLSQFVPILPPLSSCKQALLNGHQAYYKRM